MLYRAGFQFLVLALCLPSFGQIPLHAGSTSANRNAHSIPPPEARIDINHASLDQLLKAPGMKATWAARIVRFRPYRTKQDLLDRGILPSDVFDRVKDCIIAHREKQ